MAEDPKPRRGVMPVRKAVEVMKNLNAIVAATGPNKHSLALVLHAILGSSPSGSTDHLAHTVKRLFEEHLRKGGIDDRGKYWFRTKAGKPFGPAFGERELEQLSGVEMRGDGDTPVLEAMQNALLYGANRGKRDYRRATKYLEAIKVYLS